MLGYSLQEILLLNITDWNAQWSREELLERLKANIGKVICSRPYTVTRTVHSLRSRLLPVASILTASLHLCGQSRHQRTQEGRRGIAGCRRRVETHDAILITDTKANILRVNQAFTDITGYTLDEVLGKNPRVMSSGKQDKAFYVEMWQQLLHTGSWAGEIWDKRKNGQIYPSGSPSPRQKRAPGNLAICGHFQ